jgi:hypothetical protein
MQSRIANSNDIIQILEIIESHTHQYGLDIVKSGHREKHINHIIKVINHQINNKFVIISVKDDIVLGVCLQILLPKYNVWWINNCYIRKQHNKNGFADTEIGAIMFDKMCEVGENNNIYKCQYIVRDVGTHRLDLTISKTTWAKYNYKFKTLEKLPAYTKSKLPLVNLMFGMNGQNKKPVIVRSGIFE